MENKKTKGIVGSVLLVCGAHIAYLIGAGFATGQEVVQYFASNGVYGFASMALCLIIVAFVNHEYGSRGWIEQFEDNGKIYEYYAGKWLGKIFDIITQLAVYSCFLMMCSGAGASLNQYYGLPVWVGVVGMAVLAGGTVLLGLRNLTNIIGTIGPLIVILVLVICIPSIFTGDLSVGEGMQRITELDGIVKISDNWVICSLNYVGISVLWAISFLPILGKSQEHREAAAYGPILSSAAFYLACGIMVCALFANCEVAAVAQVPLLALAGRMGSVIGSLVSIMVLLGIYSSAVPLLYSPIVRFVDENTTQGKIAFIAAAAIAAVIALFVPYSIVVNVVMGISGYAGIILAVVTLVKVIMRKKQPANSAEKESV